MVAGDAIGRIIAALDDVENRRTLPIRVGDLAEAAGCSLFHFIRIFNAVTWYSPYDYVMRRKIGLASCRVLDTGDSLLDIALDLGFESPEGFSRAFRRVFGVNPSDARKTGTVDARKIISVPTELMLGVLSRCRAVGASDFRGGTSLEVRSVPADDPADGIIRAVEDAGETSWMGVVFASAADGGPQVFAGPGGPFKTDLPGGAWHEAVHRGPSGDLAAMPALADFAFRTALGLAAPPEWVLIRRSGEDTRIFLRCPEDADRTAVP